MIDSVIINMKYAEYDLIDGSPNVDRHHVPHGTANRAVADREGLWVPLKKQHHQEGKKPDPGVRCDAHHCKIFDTLLCIVAQVSWERNRIAKMYERQTGISVEESISTAREDWRRLFGKSWL